MAMLQIVPSIACVVLHYMVDVSSRMSAVKGLSERVVHMTLARMACNF